MVCVFSKYGNMFGDFFCLVVRAHSLQKKKAQSGCLVPSSLVMNCMLILLIYRSRNN